MKSGNEEQVKHVVLASGSDQRRHRLAEALQLINKSIRAHAVSPGLAGYEEPVATPYETAVQKLIAVLQLLHPELVPNTLLRLVDVYLDEANDQGVSLEEIFSQDTGFLQEAYLLLAADILTWVGKTQDDLDGDPLLLLERKLDRYDPETHSEERERVLAADKKELEPVYTNDVFWVRWKLAISYALVAVGQKQISTGALVIEIIAQMPAISNEEINQAYEAGHVGSIGPRVPLAERLADAKKIKIRQAGNNEDFILDVNPNKPVSIKMLQDLIIGGVPPRRLLEQMLRNFDTTNPQRKNRKTFVFTPQSPPAISAISQ